MTPDAELTMTLETETPLTVVSARIEEGLARCIEATLEVATTTPLELTDVLEQTATLALCPEGFPARMWSLRVGHVDFLGLQEGSMRYRVQLFDALWLLRFTTETRKFRSQSVEGIVSHILERHVIDHRFELSRSLDVRKYCAQYRESNLAFVRRLCEHEGIYFFFEDDGTVVLADDSLKVPFVEGRSDFDLLEAAGALQWSDVGIYAIKKGRRVTSGAVTVNDHNWKKPTLSLLNTAKTTSDSELEVYDFPTGFRRPDQGKRLAEHRLQSLRVEADYREGSGNVTSFRPGRSFRFGTLAGASFGGEFTLIRVTHHYANRKFSEHVELGDDDVNYRNDFFAIDRSTPFRPPVTTPHPHIAGCHTALVRGPAGEEIHTDVHGRFRAQFHWDREAVGTDEDSRWLRNTQEVASGLVLARVGWEQSIAYINGDPDRPFGFARNINAVMGPEYAQPTNKTRMSMKSPSYPNKGGFNELRMEDLGGQQHMDWFAERDISGQVGVDRSEHVGVDESKNVSDVYVWNVGQDQTVSIGGNFTLGVADDQVCTVGQDRSLSIGGDDELTTTKVSGYQVEGDSLEKVGGDRIVRAAEENGAINRIAVTHAERKIGGSLNVEGAGNLDIVVQSSLTETITGDRFAFVNEGGIDHRVGGNTTVTISQNAVRKAKESIGAAAKHNRIQVGASANMNAGNKLAINGDRIVIEADSSLRFASQSLQLELTPAKTTFSGPVTIDASTLKAFGNPHNLSN